MDPRGGDYQQQARYFAARAVLEGEGLTTEQEDLARAVLEVVLLAGLVPYNIEAAADGEETGVGLAPVQYNRPRTASGVAAGPGGRPAPARRAVRHPAGRHAPGAACHLVRLPLLD
ncbi:hypothetical protein AB0B79_06160 [Streptomyces sp. NPDC039022]|uniref:hypothetical protein n=1 Tax=Streptomyces sp. NPDC039022 TaxID=3157091 RepID=UPI0033DA5545